MGYKNILKIECIIIIGHLFDKRKKVLVIGIKKQNTKKPHKIIITTHKQLYIEI